MTPGLRRIGLCSLILGLASTVDAQEVPRQVRFTTTAGGGDHRWQGRFERLTRDSLYIGPFGTDTTAAFSRTAIGSLERGRLVHSGRAAGIGCLALGAALGALGYFGTHDPDSPGLEKTAGVLGLAVGCGVGAVGGFLVSVVRGHGWEPWTPPDSGLSIVPPKVP